MLRAGVAALLLSTVVVVALAAGVGAQTTGPSISLSQSQVKAGDRVTVSFDGFEARSATLSVCGNRAARGSADCNLVESQGVRLRHMDVVMVHDMTVTVPSLPCPCVIRAVGVDTGETAVAPIDLMEHPIGEVVVPDLGQPIVQVGLAVADEPVGFVETLKVSLGGATTKVATVTVTNLSTEPISSVTVHGRASRRGTTNAEFDLSPGTIEPGRTWTGTAEVELPAPAMGEYEWTVTASGAGPVMSASASDRQVPWLFAMFLLAFAGVISAVLVRALQRRADARRSASDAEAGEIDSTGDGGQRGAPLDAESDTPSVPGDASEQDRVAAFSGGGAPPPG